MWIVASVFVACALGFVGFLLVGIPGTAVPLTDPDGRPLPGSLSEKAFLGINGVEQGMFIKSKDARAPVLLVVHGGPGMPDYFLTQRYPTHLEDYFTVVWWEQRGTGISYRPGIPAESMTIEQFIADTLAVTDYLRGRFGKEKIYLFGHSWGSFIGVQAAARAPERYHAYVGMSQLVHQLESEKLAHEYMLQRYRDLGDTGMVRRLEAAPVTMEDGTSRAYLELRDEAMHKLGVGTTHDMKSVITDLFFPSFFSREYTPLERVNLWRGRSFSRSFGIWEQVIRTDLTKKVPALGVPAYFFHGAFDYTANYALAKDYYRSLEAPLKGFYTFENSAHSPVLEEPERARRIFQEDVLAGTNGLADPN